mgnify:CR=1 FL=1
MVYASATDGWRIVDTSSTIPSYISLTDTVTPITYATSALDTDFLKKCIGDRTLGISINASWIFKDEIIKMFKGKLINYHNAKLPEERGAAAYSWKIMRGERKGQLTLHQIAKKIDTGPICNKMDIEFPGEVKCSADIFKYMEIIYNYRGNHLDALQSCSSDLRLSDYDGCKRKQPW